MVIPRRAILGKGTVQSLQVDGEEKGGPLIPLDSHVYTGRPPLRVQRGTELERGGVVGQLKVERIAGAVLEQSTGAHGIA